MLKPIHNKVRELLDMGKTKNEISKFLRAEYKIGKTTSYDAINRVTKHMVDTTPVEGYRVCATTGIYEINTPSTPEKVLRLAQKVVEELRYDYTKGDYTIGELAEKYSITKPVLVEALKSMNITKRSAPITKEKLNTTAIDDIVSELELRDKETLLQKAINKKQEENAKNWIALEKGIIVPTVDNMIKTIAPLPAIKYVFSNKPLTKKTFVVGAFDWHIGSKARQIDLNVGNDWNMAIAAKAVDKYAEKVVGIIARTGKDYYEQCVVLLGGDLFHTLTGDTSNKTDLNKSTEDTGIVQLEKAVELLLRFISRLAEIFSKVQIRFVKGNHGGQSDLYLAKILEHALSNTAHINFNTCSKQLDFFRIYNTGILLTHGAADEVKSKTPQGSDTVIAGHVARMFMANVPAEKLVGVTTKLFVQGDVHYAKFVNCERDMYYIQSGALPFGCMYASKILKSSNVSQLCLVLDENGIVSYESVVIKAEECM